MALWHHTPPMSKLDHLNANVEAVQSELRMMREVLDEFRVDFQWAVQNDRLQPGAIADMVQTTANQVNAVVDAVEVIAEALPEAIAETECTGFESAADDAEVRKQLGLFEAADKNNVVANETDGDSQAVGVESNKHQRLSFVRPDRQFDYGIENHWEWPAAEHDRDMISVDRIRDDIDGGPHRFLIHRDDCVEVFLNSDRMEIGQVVGISQSQLQVRVAFSQGSEGIWFDVGQIYPAAEEDLPTTAAVGLTELVESASVEPADGFEESDRVCEPLLIEEVFAYREQLHDSQTDLAAHKYAFARLHGNQQPFMDDLTKRFDAKRLKILANRCGCFDAGRNSKPENAVAVYRALLTTFALSNSIQYDLMEGSRTRMPWPATSTSLTRKHLLRTWLTMSETNKTNSNH